MRYKKITAIIIAALCVMLSGCSQTASQQSTASAAAQSQAPAPEEPRAAESAPAEQQTPESEAPPADSPAADSTTPDIGNTVLEQIAASYSASSFIPGEVPEEDIQLILQSGIKAPSARNEQPWHFTVLQQAENVQKAHRQAAEGSIAIVVSGKQTDIAPFDCALSAAYMQLAAESMGYGARIVISPVSSLEQDRARYEIPDGYDVLAALIIGHTDSPDTVSSASPRNPIEDMVNFPE